MTLKAVLLDIDGTLLDSNHAHALAWHEALLQNGHEVPYNRLRPLIGKGGDKLLIEVADIDEASQEGKQISETRRSLFASRYLPWLKPTNGARDLLVRLRDVGLQLVVATSAGRDELAELLRQAGVEDLMQTTASSSDAEGSKPDPDIVQSALDKAGLSPGEAVMLGDTPYDVEAAAASGVPTIALRCGGWWTDASLSGAVAIYDDPADLLIRVDESPLSSRIEKT
jgi:HAD superfamily hydrolase (TIGR01509 family)